MAAPRKKHDQGAATRLVARLGDRLALALMVLAAAAIVGLVVTVVVLAQQKRSAQEQIVDLHDEAASADLEVAYDAIVTTADEKLPEDTDAVVDVLNSAHPHAGVVRSGRPAVDQYVVCPAVADGIQVTTRSATGTQYTLTVEPDASGYTIAPHRGCGPLTDP